MKISVITTVYDKENLLMKNVESTLAQKDVEFELVLVDDASPDRCPEMIRQIAKQHPNVRAIHREKNGGHVTAYNTGIAQAIGEYIILVDADDYLNDVYALRDMLEIAERDKADVVLSDLLNVYPKAPPSLMNGTGREVLMHLLKEKTYHPSTRSRLFKSEVFRDNPLKNLIVDDEEWFLRTIFCLNKVSIFPRSIYTRTTPENSVTKIATEANKYRKSSDRITAAIMMDKFFKKIDLNRYERNLIYTRILQLYMMAINIRLTEITSNEYKTELDKQIMKSSYLLKDSRYINNYKYKAFYAISRFLGIEKALQLYRVIL